MAEQKSVPHEWSAAQRAAEKQIRANVDMEKRELKMRKTHWQSWASTSKSKTDLDSEISLQ